MFKREKIEYKTKAQMLKMREAGLVTSALLDASCEVAVAGATTREIDAAARKVLAEQGAASNFLGYHGYPATVCVSVNDEVVHGIPGERRLQAGDVVSIDAGAIVDGWHGDSARTVVVGGVAAAMPEHIRLSEVVEEAMWAGIAAMASGRYVSDVGNAIEDFTRSQADGDRYGIIEEYVGHGIGSSMHQPPDVFCYRAGRDAVKLRNGMCLAIEPMFTLGSIDTITLADGWTVVTANHEFAAHWEHSVAKHDRGIWVLTAPDGGSERMARYGVEPVMPQI